MADLASALATGDVRAQLEAVRDRIVSALDEAKPGEVASLAKQLVEVLGKLAALPSGEVSKRDDLARKRNDRRAAVSDSSGVGKQRRQGSGRASS